MNVHQQRIKLAGYVNKDFNRVNGIEIRESCPDNEANVEY